MAAETSTKWSPVQLKTDVKFFRWVRVIRSKGKAFEVESWATTGDQLVVIEVAGVEDAMPPHFPQGERVT